MDGPPAEEAAHQIEELIAEVGELRRRVEALERRSEVSGPPVEARAALPPPAVETAAAELSSGLLAGLGRMLLGIAGAYLLRAITEANLLPQLAGTVAGVLYAYGWLAAAHRAGTMNRWAAPLQGLTASIILGPLLWEATVRFHVLTPSAAAIVLACFVVLGQVAAWRRDLSLLAGLVAAAGVITAIALIIATLDPLPFAAAIVAAAATVELGASRDRALSTRWITALASDFYGFLLAYLITRPHGLPEGYAPVPVAVAVAILWTLLAVYLASALFRTLARRLPIGWLESAQVLALAVLAIGTTLEVVHSGTAIGFVCLASAAGSYLAFRRTQERNTHVYSAFALLLSLTGGYLLFRELALAALWCALAVAAAGLGERQRRNTLRIHGALYLMAAAWVSGLLNWYPPMESAAVPAVASALTYALTLRLRVKTGMTWQELAPSVVTAGLLCWSLVALATGSAIVSRLPAPAASPLRTAMISAIAVVLAWLGSRRGLTELIWLLYPWMTLGAVKLLWEDFGKGRPATLVVSLFFYGAALIALPRLLRRSNREPPGLS